MKLLALDTSSIACSVALGSDAGVVERYAEQPREHTRLLLPMIRSVLDETGVKLTSLDAIVLGNGPGSFIGMRIAASVAQGLAHGSGLGIVPVSSLAAVAVAVLAETAEASVAVTQDAHMSEVYVGLYEADADGLPVPVAAERIHGQGAIAELENSNKLRWIPAGAGWERYPELLENNRRYLAEPAEARYPRAMNLLPLGRRELLQHDALAPAQLEPAYLRKKVASAPAATS